MASLKNGRFGCLKQFGRPSCEDAWFVLDRRFEALFERGVVSWEGGALKAASAVGWLILSTVNMSTYKT